MTVPHQRRIEQPACGLFSCQSGLNFRLSTFRIFACRLITRLIFAAGCVAIPACAELPMAERTERRVETLQARRDAAVVKQQFDYSCGSAALATLLSFGLDDRVSEQDLLRALLEPLSAAELAKLEHQGLTLAALQKLARARGHRAQGFRIESSQLAALTRPVIVFIRPNGFPHYAVLKGLRGDRAYLADPTLGNLRLPLYQFLSQWADESGRGVILAVEPNSGQWPPGYALQLRADQGDAVDIIAAQHSTTITKALAWTSP
jgi:predicted double-glycine peptidase